MTRTFADSLTQDLAAFFNVNEFAQLVTLSRGTHDETPDVSAIVAQRMYELVDDSGIGSLFHAVDFDLPAVQYEIAGSRVDPRPGDHVATADGECFEVLPIPGRPCWEPLGQTGEIIRVHTKRVVNA